MSQENTQQLLIDSQESSSQGDYYQKVVLRGWAISKSGGNIEKKTRYCGKKCRAGLRKKGKVLLNWLPNFV